MIICDDRQFAFIHIPKCAGTSVRRSLRGIDTTGEAFFRIADHPVMGSVHLAHLTLADLAEHYPETFDKVVRYRSMAIVRQPLDRFYSAIFQRLREFKEVAQSAISEEMLEADGEAVIAYLERASGRLDLEHVHFNRQCEFVELGRDRIVQDIFPVTRMSEAAEYVRQVAGVEIGDEKRNQTTQLRFGPLRPLQRLLRERYAKLVSAERRASIREKMTRAGFYAEVSKERLVKSGGRIERFVRDYYARDFELFEQSENRLAACPA
jgi:hypothetical protein